jgi:hypothetical protein
MLIMMNICSKTMLGAALALTMLAATGQAATFKVKSTWTSQSAIDADPDGTGLVFGSTGFGTIAAAATAAHNNGAVVTDDIIVFPGTYAGFNMSTNAYANANKINFIGPNANIDPNNGTRGPEAILTSGIILTNRTDITINGFTFTSAQSQGRAYNVTFSHNIHRDITGSAFVLAGNLATPGNNYTITRSLFQNILGSNNSALNLFAGSPGVRFTNVTVSYNTFNNVAYAGIQTNGISGLNLIGNTISNTGRHGINIGPSTTNIVIAGNIITNVNFQNNRTDQETGGIRLYSGTDGVSNVTIVNNIVENANNGIFFRPQNYNNTNSLLPPNTVIEGNNLTNSVYGGITVPPFFDVTTSTPTISGNFIAGNMLGDILDPSNLVTVTNPSAEPIVADSDGDGLADWEELYVYNTNPNNADQDGDGMDDGLQIALGGNPLTNTPANDPRPTPTNGDSDGDGYRDIYEALVGTDWTNPNSKPTLGDLNGNGVIDNADAAIVFNIVAGNLSPFGFNSTRMDANQDGVLNNQDANALFGKFLGITGFTLLPAN